MVQWALSRFSVVSLLAFSLVTINYMELLTTMTERGEKRKGAVQVIL